MKYLIAIFFSMSATVYADNSNLVIPSLLNQVPATLTINLSQGGEAAQMLPNFTLRLPACVDCGASWEVKNQPSNFAQTTFETTHNTIVEKGFVSSSGSSIPPVGGASVQVIQFPGLKQGTYDFSLSYGRPWDPDSEKQNLEVEVTVTP